MMPLAACEAGVGHLRRSAQVAAQLPDAALAVPAPETAAAVSALAKLELRAPLRDTAGGAGGFEVVALDRRATSLADLLKWTGSGLGVGIDEGGPARTYLPVLLDTVPRPERHAPNAANLRWALVGPRTLANGGVRRDRGPTRWLVSFGGDDPAHLSEKVAASLIRVAGPDIEVVVVVGPRFGEREWPPSVSLLPPQASLNQLLAEAALVCTAYGLTAYEALAAGTPVLLANPSRYHQRLAEASGIPSLGVAAPWRRFHERRLASLVGRPERLQRAVATVRRLLTPDALQEHSEDQVPSELSDLLDSLQASGPVSCPSCGRRLTPAVARFADRTYRRCRRCQLIHMVRFAPSPSGVISYDCAYFFDEYRRQYGRTYLEDFAHIRATGFERLRRMARCRPAARRRTPWADPGGSPRPRLLDVGCAFGPFLDAARRRGWDPAGIDVSSDAVAHVVEQLGLPAMVGSIEELGADEVARALTTTTAAAAGEHQRFDAVTMWYVIEHLVELRRVLLLARQLLVVGGVLAFSTPSSSGISGRRSLRRFLQHSPGDHYTVWHPRSARQVLHRYGFRVRRVRVTGHHPERFPLAAGRGPVRALYRLVAAAASRMLRLGDTFEVYATALPEGAPSHRRRRLQRRGRKEDV